MLEKLENLMSQYIKSLENQNAYELFTQIPSGKRLRAKLIFKIANFSEESLKLAAIVELIHAASLLHDDVIDEANSRRGVESINAKFGNKTAIMLGDILYAKGFFELATISKDIAQIISNAVCELSIGELIDVNISESFNENEELYFEMIYKKTASLIEASAKAAANLSSKDEAKFAKYGKNLGIAFQIIDDILDITQDSKTLGKPNLNDFKEGKTTLPYIYLHQSINEQDKEKLKSMFKKDLNKDEQSWIKAKFDETGSLKKAKNLALNLGKEALETIKDEKNEELENIIKTMIKREF